MWRRASVLTRLGRDARRRGAVNAGRVAARARRVGARRVRNGRFRVGIRSMAALGRGVGANGATRLDRERGSLGEPRGAVAKGLARNSVSTLGTHRWGTRPTRDRSIAARSDAASTRDTSRLARRRSCEVAVRLDVSSAVLLLSRVVSRYLSFASLELKPRLIYLC